MIKWVSVEDKIPLDLDVTGEINDYLIAYKKVCDRCCSPKGQYISVGYYVKGRWRLVEPLLDDIFEPKHHDQIKVTHFMSLPELPK